LYEYILHHTVALLRQVVQTLQDTVRNQGVLITDLRQRNQQQEKRIQELETAQKNRDKHHEPQKKRIQELEAAQKNRDEYHELQEKRIQELEVAQKNRDEYHELQERRIQELEVAQKNRDEDRALQEYRLKYLESKFSSDDMALQEDTKQHTDQSTHRAIVEGGGTENDNVNRRGWYIS
jgi:cellulose biosynthesis protein BcsQ